MLQTMTPVPESQAPTPAVSPRQPEQQSIPRRVPERPTRAPNVELMGALQGTGFKDRQWLLLRNGQFLQVTELLYRILEYADGTRTLEEIAAQLTEETDWIVAADQVHTILQNMLIPQGLIVPAEGMAVAPPSEQARSPLSVNLRMRFLNPQLLEPITKLLQVFYAPAMLIPMLVAMVIAHGWLYFEHGISGSLRAALFMPGSLLVLLSLALVAGLFHELGHAAALRYGGGKVRGIGVGLYLIYPVFYTDVTDSYRLGRWARVRTDLGGIYFHLIFALVIMAISILSGYEFLMVLVPLINLIVIRELLPFVRFDGYWLLADLTGIPDFFSQIGPFVRSLLPASMVRGSRLPPLKPWVKVSFLFYIVLTIPMLVIFFFLMIRGVPELITTTWDAARYQIELFALAWEHTHILLMALVVTQLIFLALPVLATAYILSTSGWQMLRGIWKWSVPTPQRRFVGTFTIVGVLSLVALLWFPLLDLVRQPMPTGLEHFEVTQRDHVRMTVVYDQIPPVGGNHAPIWQNCGFYSRAIANEHGVHSLEHGAVWITYRPDLPAKQIEQLRRIAERQSYILVSPYPRLPAPVVASAWGWQLKLDSPDDPRLEQFIRMFRLGQQAPEQGAPCTEGVGTPGE